MVNKSEDEAPILPPQKKPTPAPQAKVQAQKAKTSPAPQPALKPQPAQNTAPAVAPVTTREAEPVQETPSLTGEALVRRQRQIEALKTIPGSAFSSPEYLSRPPAFKSPAPSALPAIAGNVDDVIMHTANPYLNLYREFRMGVLTLAQLEEAIDLAVVQDAKLLKSYEYELPPQIPSELLFAEQELEMSTHKDDLKEAIKLLHKKLGEIKPNVGQYFRTKERRASENLSRFWWLKCMYERLRGPHPVHAGKVLEVIQTHDMSFSC